MREDVLRYEIISRLDELADRLELPAREHAGEHAELRELVVALRRRLTGFGLVEVSEP